MISSPETLHIYSQKKQALKPYPGVAYIDPVVHIFRGSPVDSYVWHGCQRSAGTCKYPNSVEDDHMIFTISMVFVVVLSQVTNRTFSRLTSSMTAFPQKL